MSRTSNLRRQHDAAVALVAEIGAMLGTTAPDQARCYALGLKLAKLSGLLRIHFAQEDHTLYPMMAQSSNATAAATAAAFQAEMGDLGTTYAAFTERWRSGRAIAADFARFSREARAIFAALALRIERENDVLYPLADALSPSEARHAA